MSTSTSDVDELGKRYVPNVFRLESCMFLPQLPLLRKRVPLNVFNSGVSVIVNRVFDPFLLPTNKLRRSKVRPKWVSHPWYWTVCHLIS